MGNCIETCNHYQSWRREEITAGTKQMRFEEDRGQKVSNRSGFDDLWDCSRDDSSSGNKGVMRVKIVLTREELEWLMVQLSESSNGGGDSSKKKRSLEEVLGEIERGRSLLPSPPSSRTAAWRPSLESIMEIPEVPERMDRS